MNNVFRTIAIGSLCSFCYADETVDEIKAGLELYEAGEYDAASEALQQALVYVNNKKTDVLKKFFPAEISAGGKAYKAGEVKNEKGGAMFGMTGIMLNSQYEADGSKCTLKLSLDSPLLTQMTGLLKNPQMASAMGYESVRLGRVKAMYNEKNQSVVVIHNARFYVEVLGKRDKEMDKERLVEFAKGLDFSILDNLK